MNWYNGVFYNYNDAVKDAIDNVGAGINHVFVAECITHSNNMFFPDGDYIINYMQSNADDVGGDHACDYLDVANEDTDDLTQRMEELLNKWCDDHGIRPTFYDVKSGKLVKIK